MTDQSQRLPNFVVNILYSLVGNQTIMKAKCTLFLAFLAMSFYSNAQKSFCTAAPAEKLALDSTFHGSAWQSKAIEPRQVAGSNLSLGSCFQT